MTVGKAFGTVDVIAPKQIIIPSADPTSGAAYIANAQTGTLVMSGAKLYVFSGAGWELITSA